MEENYDPARLLEYENQSYCPELRDSGEIMDLYHYPAIARIVDAAVGLNRIDNSTGQIAIRKGRNAAAASPPYPHIDGIPTPHNGVAGDRIKPFTILIGIFLSEVSTEFAGNFTVWPGSHLLLEQYFRERGPSALTEGMPKIPLGDALQLHCSPGDVVVCHYQLAHGAAVNISANDRYAVFFRLWFHELDADAASNGWGYLTDIWRGWKISKS